MRGKDGIADLEEVGEIEDGGGWWWRRGRVWWWRGSGSGLALVFWLSGGAVGYLSSSIVGVGGTGNLRKKGARFERDSKKIR
jgi:hypothetical protein